LGSDHPRSGSAARELPQVLKRISQPALFWLDGHFSGGITAKGDKDPPLLEELQAIREHRIKRHVLLIDDIRLFGSGGYPTMEEVVAAVHEISDDHKITLAADVLCCEPA
jgi:hypothetical protein